jgi:hypothetical protein
VLGSEPYRDGENHEEKRKESDVVRVCVETIVADGGKRVPEVPLRDWVPSPVSGHCSEAATASTADVAYTEEK